MASLRLSDYLRRFRPTAAPGAAAPAGVPTDVVAGVEAELAPVFAALDADRNEVARVGEQARQRAQHITEDAAAEVVSIEADARRDAAAARAQASAEQAELAEAERAEILDAAAAEAVAIDARSASRMAELVGRVVAAARDGGRGEGGPGSARPSDEGEP